jgi:acyl-lipid omega-6 desaturase (Delta-12 desaturase)
MEDGRQKHLAEVAEGFTAAKDWVSVAAMLFDWSLYGLAVVAGVVASAIWVKLIAVVVAGTAISMLFILGHDAAHRSLVSGKKLNSVLARLVFLPCLHNYTLWVIQHNRLHHQSSNVRGLNSYSPLSPEEFSRASFGRRILERVYRSPVGFGAYYLVERWWKDKFFPRARIEPKQRARAWADFFILSIWSILFIWALVQLSARFGGSGPLWAILWGFVAPFLVWNQLMGTTAFLQHTHPRVPWFRTYKEARATKSQAELTVLVQYPAWYDVLSHNIMQHQAHHVSARIPWFRLKSAQRRLTPMLGSDVVVEQMGFGYLMNLVRHCQLYDYDSNKWVPFTGRFQETKTTQLVGARSRDFGCKDQLGSIDKSGSTL